MQDDKKKKKTKSPSEQIDQRINKISKEIEDFKTAIKSKLEHKI